MKRYVFSIPSTATIRQAAALVVARHIGLLPVVDQPGKLVGVIGLRDLLSLELPDFFNLLPDLDFVHDFGAVEVNHPSPDSPGIGLSWDECAAFVVGTGIWGGVRREWHDHWINRQYCRSKHLGTHADPHYL
jgi:CBS domain-containing protein